MQKLIVANWKCNPTNQKEAEKLFNSIKDGVKEIRGVEIIVCPPFVYLSVIKIKNSNIRIGAQDSFWEKSGAFTGGVSPLMLKDLDCQYVILGHSERRIFFGNTDEIINKKIKAAISVGLEPIFCIGETEVEKKKGETWKVLENQIKKGLNGVSEEEMENIVMAYEPVWAIGTGNPCSSEETKKTALIIRKITAKLYSDKISNNLIILYGGSINSENIGNYLAGSGISGFLVGGASLKSEEFIKIVKIVSQS